LKASSSRPSTRSKKDYDTLLHSLSSRGNSHNGVGNSKDSTIISGSKDGEKRNDHIQSKDGNVPEKSAHTTGTMTNTTPTKGSATSGKTQEEEEDEFLLQSVERALNVPFMKEGGVTPYHGVTSSRSSPIRKHQGEGEKLCRGDTGEEEEITGSKDGKDGRNDVESIDDYVEIGDSPSLPGSCGQNFTQDAYLDIGEEYDEKIDEEEDLFGERKDFEMSGTDDIFQNSVSPAEKKDETTKSTRDIEKFDAGFMTKVYSVSDPEKTSKQRKAYYRLFE